MHPLDQDIVEALRTRLIGRHVQKVGDTERGMIEDVYLTGSEVYLNVSYPGPQGKRESLLGIRALSEYEIEPRTEF